MSDYQLFVGRLPRGTRGRDLEDVFYKYGKLTRCDVKQGDTCSFQTCVYALTKSLSLTLSLTPNRNKDG